MNFSLDAIIESAPYSSICIQGNGYSELCPFGILCKAWNNDDKYSVVVTWLQSLQCSDTCSSFSEPFWICFAEGTKDLLLNSPFIFIVNDDFCARIHWGYFSQKHSVCEEGVCFWLTTATYHIWYSSNWNGRISNNDCPYKEHWTPLRAHAF